MIKIAFTEIRPHFEKKIKDKDNDKKIKTFSPESSKVMLAVAVKSVQK